MNGLGATLDCVAKTLDFQIGEMLDPGAMRTALKLSAQ
jgi:hypothetical protein